MNCIKNERIKNEIIKNERIKNKRIKNELIKKELIHSNPHCLLVSHKSPYIEMFYSIMILIQSYHTERSGKRTRMLEL